MITAPLRRPRLTDATLSVFQHARLEPLAHEANDALVADPVLEETDQPVVVDRVEGTPDTLPISKTFRRQCASCAGAMPLKGKNSRCSGAASVQASCICC